MFDQAAMPPGHYLVLGSTGLVGSHSLLRLSEREGIQVRAVYHKRKPHIFANNIEYVNADLTERGDCDAVMTDIDYMLLFAGIILSAPVTANDPVGPVMTNLLLTSQSLKAAYHAGIKKVVWLSSTTGYPPLEGRIKEDEMFQGDPPDVNYPIGWMTRYVETLCNMYTTKLPRNMTVIVLRPTMIYGEYDEFRFDRAHFLPAFIRRVVERENPIEVWGTGEQTRDVIHAADVVEASLLALQYVDEFETFNIAHGRSHTINDILHSILAIDNYSDAQISHLKSTLVTVSNRSFDNGKAKRILRFEPQITMETGIKRTIEWYRREHEFLSIQSYADDQNN